MNSIPLDAEFYQAPYNVLRRAKLMVLTSCLDKFPEFLKLSYKEKTKLIKKIERSCYNYVIDKSHEENIISTWDDPIFCDLYHSICYKVSSNIDPDNLVQNNKLGRRLLANEISIDNLPKLTSQELFPERYMDILQKVEVSKTVSQTLKTSALYTCKKCKQNKCTMENLYNRSLDEGTNLRITCMNCFHSWNG